MSRTFAQTVSDPFSEFFSRKGIKQAILVLLFIFLYKLGDSMATSLATPFYLDMGFSKTDIGLIAKNAGLWPAVIAGIVGGIWMIKLGINRALWVFGVAQWVTILGFAWLANFGKFETITLTEQMMLAAVIGAEAAGVGWVRRHLSPIWPVKPILLSRPHNWPSLPACQPFPVHLSMLRQAI